MYKTGKKIGVYVVESLAGQGGFGIVYKVRHSKVDYLRALKMPLKEEHFEKFITECKQWIKLSDHQNIVRLFDVGLGSGKRPYAVAEWVCGGSLSDRIVDGRLYEGSEQETSSRILSYAVQSANGLLYANERNVVHRDVKPANILVTKDNIVKVSDFGLAVELRDGQKTNTEHASKPFRSPEQATREVSSVKSDVFSWALTVLSMYTGVRECGSYYPWEDGYLLASESSLRDRCLNETRVEIPQNIKALLESCLQRNPELRPDFKQVLGVLEGDTLAEVATYALAEQMRQLPSIYNNQPLNKGVNRKERNKKIRLALYASLAIGLPWLIYLGFHLYANVF
ncbi:MAG: serine/threonine protein kinase [Firmicutes bacterium]|nr:serine/threonine protein kinase [Bacillota bacterium]